MDKETFEKVAKISEDMKSLFLITRKISNAKISFIGGKGYEVPMSSAQKDVIKDILSKHEIEIRKEINDRYDDLKKQIEEL